MNERITELFWFLNATKPKVLNRFANYFKKTAVVRGVRHSRFVYIPGTRSTPVLLVAHADTIWEHDKLLPVACRLEGDQIVSARPDIGIGADDRAGCAMLWALRDSGHSLLITSGEEIGCVAAREIAAASANRDIRDDINKRHMFAIEFDRRGSSDFKCYDVGTDAFRAYCAEKTGYRDAGNSSSTDIRHLCQDICGVNLSVGYYDEHTEAERLVVSEWEHTLSIVQSWLSADELPRFSLHESVGEEDDGWRPFPREAAYPRYGTSPHYIFAHRALWDIARADPQLLFTRMGMGGEYADPIVGLILNEVYKRLGVDPLYSFRSSDIKVERRYIESRDSVVLRMPPPTRMGEAYFVAIVANECPESEEITLEDPAYGESLLSFYCLQKSLDERVHSTFGYCDPRGRRTGFKAIEGGKERTVNPAPEPVMEDFIACLEEHLRREVPLRQPGVKVMMLPVPNGKWSADANDLF
ncbi:MAG: hypothetical protein WCO60_16825 [Verrucomicrobiota bacterium]